MHFFERTLHQISMISIQKNVKENWHFRQKKNSFPVPHIFRIADEEVFI